MEKERSAVEKLLREIVGAYKATQNKPMNAPDQVKHLRYQVARLARVCIEMEKRIIELEHSSDKRAGSKSGGQDDETLSKITSIGDII